MWRGVAPHATGFQTRRTHENLSGLRFPGTTLFLGAGDLVGLEDYFLKERERRQMPVFGSVGILGFTATFG